MNSFAGALLLPIFRALGEGKSYDYLKSLEHLMYFFGALPDIIRLYLIGAVLGNLFSRANRES